MTPTQWIAEGCLLAALIALGICIKQPRYSTSQDAWFLGGLGMIVSALALKLAFG